MRGTSRYTCQGGGPADGALYSAVIADPDSSTRAGQPSAGPPPWQVYGLVPRTATSLLTVEPGGATRWRF